ncbi:arginine--tRNA ligase [Pirellulaceae bacterium SH449]
MQLLNSIRARFTEVLSQWLTDPQELQTALERIVPSKDANLADYQANVAMPLQKLVGKPPLAIAQEIVDGIRVDDFCQEVAIAGPGYVNLRLSNAFLVNLMQTAYESERQGVEQTAAPKTYVVDFSSPNVAKPMHVGHIRSTVIGDAISKTLQFLGHSVITDNHLGDWGTQFGMIIYGYKHFRDEQAFAAAPVKELGRLYRIVQRIISYQKATGGIATREKGIETAATRIVAIQQKASENPKDKKLAKEANSAAIALKNLKDEHEQASELISAVAADSQLHQWCTDHPNLDSLVLKETAKLHRGDKENVALWEQFLPACKEEIHAIYKRLSVTFDHEYGESFYHDMLPAVIEELLNQSLATQSEGAICVFLEQFDAPMIVQKQDGAFLYSTTDIATALFREREFGPDVCLYVVDHRQSEHFQKLFAVLAKLGLTHTDYRHISFGTVMGKDGKPFKTRAGDNIGLESLLDEAIDRAWAVVCNPNRLQSAGLELTESEKRNIAEVIGIGAIKYADLSHNRTSDYVFDMDKMVALEGNTSAYVQYSYARTRSILRRATEAGIAESAWSTAPILIEAPAERALAIQIARFEDTLQFSMNDFLPNAITEYLFDTAKIFGTFFDQCPVLKADSEEKKLSRLKLAELTGRVLQRGLGLLGIGTVERM